MKLADYVVTESGFAADLGAEKFMHIICRYGGFAPSAVVITCTMRALKMHGGLPADKELLKAENNAALEKGCENLEKQIENMKLFGIPVVVTLNRFDFDRDSEIEIVRKRAIAAGAEAAIPIEVHAKGGAGGHEAAEAICAAADKGGDFHFLYELDAPIKQKIETIAIKIYGADGVDYLPAADDKIKRFTEQGLDKLPHLHGQDAPLAQSRPHGEGPSAGLPRADPRHPPGDRRGLPLPAARRDAHHARPAQAAGGGRCRHRRRPPARSSGCSEPRKGWMPGAGRRTPARPGAPPSRPQSRGRRGAAHHPTSRR